MALAVLAAGCAAAPVVDDSPHVDTSGLVLPAGEGRALLENACTKCHDLGGLEGYKGYYNAERWRGLVTTMVEHGAELEGAEIDAVVGYLTAYFGPDAS